MELISTLMSAYFSDTQHSQMLTMLQARHAGDEGTVHRILTEYRELRCRRRPRSALPSENRPEQGERKEKRRKCLPATRYEEYCCLFPQVSFRLMIRNGSNKLVLRSYVACVFTSRLNATCTSIIKPFREKLFNFYVISLTNRQQAAIS